MPTDEFDPTLLSTREHEILNFAADGLTDIQIALRLDIRPSTVNSYWVRIRSKLGHRSRTELVAMALRKQAKDETAELLLRSQQLERLAAEREGLSQSAQLAEMLKCGLQALPDAVVFVGSNGVVQFANERFSDLFGYRSDELTGMRATTLIRPHDRRRIRDLWAQCFHSPETLVIGPESTMRAQRKDRSTFPACARIGHHSGPKGSIVACIVWAV